MEVLCSLQTGPHYLLTRAHTHVGMGNFLTQPLGKEKKDAAAPFLTLATTYNLPRISQNDESVHFFSHVNTSPSGPLRHLALSSKISPGYHGFSLAVSKKYTQFGFHMHIALRERDRETRHVRHKDTIVFSRPRILLHQTNREASPLPKKSRQGAKIRAASTRLWFA